MAITGPGVEIILGVVARAMVAGRRYLAWCLLDHVMVETWVADARLWGGCRAAGASASTPA